MPDATPLDSRLFRDALGTFATGVALVTTRNAGVPVGIMINSFASVSLDPPLVLWSIANESRRKPAFEANPQSAIHILSNEQKADCMAFTKDAHAFDGLPLIENGDGPPLLDGCLARFECEEYAHHPAGDHTIIITRVLKVTTGDAQPLVFHKGSFGTIS